MNNNTVTVKFDDEKLTIPEIVEALGAVGYTVPKYSKE
jgi:hypothetical protein